MSITSLLKRVHKALPAIIANIPVVKAAAKEVKDAVRKEPKRGAGA